jgi:hypothetical protein
MHQTTNVTGLLLVECPLAHQYQPEKLCIATHLEAAKEELRPRAQAHHFVAPPKGI